MMIQWFRRGHLSPLCLTGTNFVTFIARHLFVLCMAEPNAKRGHHHRCARIAAQLMAGSARRNITSTRLRARRVAAEAGSMRVEVGRNGHRHAVTSRTMASRATHTSHVHVPRVIKLHSEAHQSRGKRFHRTRLRIGVTDCANRTVRLRKLLRVTTGARQMLRRARTLWDGRIRIATMTKQTWKSRVIAAVVLKLRVVEPFGKLHLRLWRLGCDARMIEGDNNGDCQNDQDRRGREIFMKPWGQPDF
jgi:hypothetical protein